jgi:hypothetical protein
MAIKKLKNIKWARRCYTEKGYDKDKVMYIYVLTEWGFLLYTLDKDFSDKR